MQLQMQMQMQMMQIQELGNFGTVGRYHRAISVFGAETLLAAFLGSWRIDSPASDK